MTGRWGPNTLNAVVQNLCRFARAVLGLMAFFAELRRAEDCDVCFPRVDPIPDCQLYNRSKQGASSKETWKTQIEALLRMTSEHVAIEIP